MTDTYRDAIARWPLTAEAIEAGAKALAEATAGGKWETHFTEDQRDLWRSSVRVAMALALTAETKAKMERVTGISVLHNL